MDYIIKLIRKKKHPFVDKWVWRLAWKDARFNLGRLMLFISSIIIGVAGLVAINSFNDNLQDEIDQQANELLGADLVVESDNHSLDEGTFSFVKLISEETSKGVEFASMVYFPKNGGSRLIQVKAFEYTFPFYGTIELTDRSDKSAFDAGKGAMIDESLALQFDVHVGDSLKLGKGKFYICGIVIQFPGNTNIRATWAPAVYVPYERLPETDLIQYGSRIEYQNFFKMKKANINAATNKLKEESKTNDYDWRTVETEKENMSRGFQNLYKYFRLLGFVALILGCIGVASSIFVYMREKRNSAAILRCIGASGWQIFWIFFLQVVVLGLVGSIFGVLAGIGIQYLLPWVVSDFLPMEISLFISWKSIGEGLLVGMIISILFSALPLSHIRFIAPLELIRGNISKTRIRSKFRRTIIILIILFPWLFAYYQTDDLLKGTAFYAGLLLAFLSLYLISRGLIFTLDKFMPKRIAFIWKQGFSNLFRPNNQTSVLVIVIGLGAFLISTMNLIQNSLLGQVEFVGSGERSNTVLFDIQPYQKKGVIDLVNKYNIPIQQVVPVVTMRLQSIKGRTIEDIQNDTTENLSDWALTHEYRVTYRDTLISSEELLKGKLIPHQGQERDSIFISISERLGERLKLDLKDEVVFNVQGLPVTTYVGSIRKVDWQRVQTNFMVVFPTGVLEQAPQFFVVVSRIEDKQVAAKFQQELVLSFPNVSLIDLNLILNTVDEIFDKIAFVIRFMALFSIITGMLVLSGAVINSKYARLKENVLLRTMGALRKQINGMTLIEYGYLGIFSGLAGSILALLASWALAKFFFDTLFFPDFISLLVIWTSISILTVFIGWYNSRSILNTSPLEVLRKEA